MCGHGKSKDTEPAAEGTAPAAETAPATAEPTPPTTADQPSPRRSKRAIQETERMKDFKAQPKEDESKSRQKRKADPHEPAEGVEQPSRKRPTPQQRAAAGHRLDARIDAVTAPERAEAARAHAHAVRVRARRRSAPPHFSAAAYSALANHALAEDAPDGCKTVRARCHTLVCGLEQRSACEHAVRDIQTKIGAVEIEMLRADAAGREELQLLLQELKDQEWELDVLKAGQEGGDPELQPLVVLRG